MAHLSTVLVALTVIFAGCVDVTETALPAPGSNETNQTPSDPSPSQNNSSQQRSNAESSEPEDPDNEDNGSAKEANYPPWPTPSEATIRPGVQITSDGRQCTSNFLFRTPDNASLMLGVAAHCVSAAPSQTNTNGCNDEIDPLEPGVNVRINGASNPGKLVYNSWWTMQENNETRSAVCQANDFALVEIDPDDREKTHPAVLYYGGPINHPKAAPGSGEKVVWYGNSGTRPDADPVHHNEGYVLSASGWTATVYSLTPAVPGDSGSGMMLGNGSAMGIATTLNLAPTPGATGVVMLDNALAYANENGEEVQAELVTWPLLTQGNLP